VNLPLFVWLDACKEFTSRHNTSQQVIARLQHITPHGTPPHFTARLDSNAQQRNPYRPIPKQVDSILGFGSPHASTPHRNAPLGFRARQDNSQRLSASVPSPYPSRPGTTRLGFRSLHHIPLHFSASLHHKAQHYSTSCQNSPRHDAAYHLKTRLHDAAEHGTKADRTTRLQNASGHDRSSLNKTRLHNMTQHSKSFLGFSSDQICSRHLSSRQSTPRLHHRTIPSKSRRFTSVQISPRLHGGSQHSASLHGSFSGHNSPQHVTSPLGFRPQHFCSGQATSLLAFLQLRIIDQQFH
jgi:hypothetical protein